MLEWFFKGYFLEAVKLKNDVELSPKDLIQGVQITTSQENKVEKVVLESISRDLAVKILNKGTSLQDYEKIMDPGFAMTADNFLGLWRRSRWNERFVDEGPNMMATKEVIPKVHTDHAKPKSE